jgi:outer membrane protein assembly factor BamB
MVANGIVYIGNTSGVLSAFPAACGTAGFSCSPLWQSTTTITQMQSTPAIANGVVYVTGTDSANNGLVMAFPANCSNPCTPRWTASQTGYDATNPIVSDGMVIAGDNGGELTAWDLPAATHTPQPTRPNPSTLVPDLTLEPSH